MLRTAITLMLTTLTAVAQEITISPTLRAGDAFSLEVVRIRENSSRPQESSKSRTAVDVRVVLATSKGFGLDWVYGVTVLENPRPAQNPLADAASRALQDIRFRLTLDAEGRFTGLQNHEEVMPKLQGIVDPVVKELSSRLPAEQRKLFLGLIAQVLSPEALIASATRDAQIYFGLSGVSLGAGEIAEVNSPLPNPMGSGVIPAVFRVQMESATAESASLKTTTTYDPAALIQMTQALAQQAGSPIPAGELAKLPAIQMGDDGKYVFDRRLGLMREVTVNRRVSAGNVSRYDGWEIRLVKGPTR